MAMSVHTHTRGCHQKARTIAGFLVVGKFNWGVEISPTTNALIKSPRISANPRATLFPARRWADAHIGDFSGVLMMLIQERMAKEQKKAVRLATAERLLRT